MAKPLPAINPFLEMDKILKAVRRGVKFMDCNIGEIWAQYDTTYHYLIVENDGVLGKDYLRDWIATNPLVNIVKMTETPGHYDWNSDCYIRPVSMATLTFSY